MNIKEIILYSHSGEIRRIKFQVNGLNIITGRSSTGKSALSEIVEYCMGRSTFNIPEGPIRDKVSWYAVLFQFQNEQILIAKPTPAATASSCSKAMVRRGNDIEPPSFETLEQNSDDETVVSLLSNKLGIPSYQTEVSSSHSRDSYKPNIKHTPFYLFQKQNLIANKDQLFYRQNESYIPQSIKDTLPILLGVSPKGKLELESKLRSLRRELKIAEKRLEEKEQFDTQIDVRINGLLSEAKQVGILSNTYQPEDANHAISTLENLMDWKPTPIPESNAQDIIILENELRELRKEKSELNETLRTTQSFLEKTAGFTTEAEEQYSRLQSINALPYNNEGEWQWPFAPENLNLESTIADALLNELASLEEELKTVAGEKPNLDEYIVGLEEKLQELNQNVRSKEEELASAISANETIAQMDNLNAAAAKTIGRISLFLENYNPIDDKSDLIRNIEIIQQKIDAIESEIGTDNSEDRLTSILSIISSRLDNYVKDLDAEFSEHTFRFDFKNLTIVVDRPDRPVPMQKTGGASNHLAYHIGALLAIHHFSSKNNRPIPSFLFLDQPTQVYFPSEQVYNSASGSIEETERDSDINRVRRLFEILYSFVTNECPSFQIIITEHANLRDEWFQNSIVEEPWTKPPALVPDEWESMQ
ncbi:DUF3732 domain-containing protein [Balneola vulgaris]|uniref:DUF3732 domain-containing protein n=1 Tax=Balneola vulgaris TaxID=287535 RepID=UPI00035C6670|nr:DUF3732 domain-containing protein [Balneola vulgaris]